MRISIRKLLEGVEARFGEISSLRTKEHLLLEMRHLLGNADALAGIIHFGHNSYVLLMCKIGDPGYYWVIWMVMISCV